jgi:hypothetical protein
MPQQKEAVKEEAVISPLHSDRNMASASRSKDQALAGSTGQYSFPLNFAD